MTPVTADAPRVRRSLLRALISVTAVTATALATVATTHADELGTPYPPEEPVPTTPVPPNPPVGGTTFNLLSLNVLGSTHTKSGRRARLGSGIYRTGLVVKYLEKHQVDVAGFQELQMDQWERFTELTAGRYGTFPGGLSRRMVQNSIAWNLAEWSFVEGHFVKIPYFDGVEWDMPVVLLQNLETGQLAYFGNFHNPATNRKHRNSTPYRREAERREVALANALYATGLPVFFTGDMNERERYFCTLAGGAPMKAPNGGRYSQRQGCTPPPKPMPVDWIFGAKQRGQFSDYVRDDSRLVNRISDHFAIRATVTMRGAFVSPEDAPAWPPPVVEPPVVPEDPTDPGTEELPDGIGFSVVTRRG